MKKKILCLLLVLLMLFSISSLVACGPSDENPDDNKKDPNKKPDDDKEENRWWEDITYDEETLIFMNNNDDQNQELSSGWERYLAGNTSDTQDLDEMIDERNEQAYDRTRVTIEWDYYPDNSGYGWSSNIDVIYNAVQSGKSDTPDMFHNFMTDMLATSLKGSFANLYSRSRVDVDGAQGNYFDLEDPGYMADLMQSLTLSQNKVYCVASDYFTDIIRAFFVTPVNRTLFDQIAAKGAIEDLNGDGVSDINDFFDEILNGDWTYSRMAYYSNLVYNDENNDGVSQIGDTLGFVLAADNGLHGAGMVYTSNVTIIAREWDGTKGDNNYYYPEENEILYDLCDALNKLTTENRGICTTHAKRDNISQFGAVEGTHTAIREEFARNKILFGGVILVGALEYQSYQSMKAGDTGGFGVVPIPTYKHYTDEELKEMNVEQPYLTQVHTVGRCGGIAHSTVKYARCSAFMQYMSSHSTDILNEYYDYNLTYDIADGLDGNITMLQYIRANARTAFDKLFEDAIGFHFNTVDKDSIANRWHGIICDADFKMTNMRERYASLVSGKNKYLADLVETYKGLPD